MAGDADLMRPRLQHKAIGGFREVGQAPQRNGQVEPPRFPRLQVEALKADQGALRPLQHQSRRLHIHLHHLGGGHGAGVGHRERHLQQIGLALQFQLQIAVAEAAVREAETEGKGSAMAVALQASVAMPVVIDDLGRPGLERWQVGLAAGHAEGHAARGRHPTQQHIGQGRSTLLAGIPEQQQGGHHLAPGFAEDGAATHQHHHRAGIGGRHRQNQGLLGGIEAQRRAIAGGEISACPR